MDPWKGASIVDQVSVAAELNPKRLLMVFAEIWANMLIAIVLRMQYTSVYLPRFPVTLELPAEAS